MYGSTTFDSSLEPSPKEPSTLFNAPCSKLTFAARDLSVCESVYLEMCDNNAPQPMSRRAFACVQIHNSARCNF